jgi:hypothetical protein
VARDRRFQWKPLVIHFGNIRHSAMAATMTATTIQNRGFFTDMGLTCNDIG